MLEWQVLHSDCSSPFQNNCGSPRCGSLWSATVAAVTRPRALHSAHSGSLHSSSARRASHLAVRYSGELKAQPLNTRIGHVRVMVSALLSVAVMPSRYNAACVPLARLISDVPSAV